MPVSVETYAPAPAGMNRDLPAHAVDATFASYIVDGIVDQPNFLRERGPVTKLAAFPTIPNCIPFGIIPCVDLSGGVALCIIGFNPSTNVNSIHLLSPTNYSTIASTYEINNVGRLITDYSACTQGGVLIGLSRAYDRYNTYYANRTLRWMGATKQNTFNGNITTTSGSKVVTGSGSSFLTTAEPGMFILNYTGVGTECYLVGIVDSVTSDTVLTLQENALRTFAAQGCNIASIASFPLHYSKGTMTSSSSTAIIFGSGTKWKENIIPLAANTQVMTRANNTRVGLMSSQASNTTMNLSANSSVTVTNEEYFVEHITDSMWNLSDVPQAVFGFLTTTYASRQWYANIPAPTSIDQTSRLWFSDQIDFQSVDCQGKRGDYIDIQNRSGGGPSPIVNIQGTPNALLVLKTNVTFAITGKTISSFSAEHVLDDGCIDNATVMPYHDGLIWAGKDGIYIFDGTTVINLLEDKLEKFYTEALASYNPFNATSHNTNRACAVIYRDHYICNINPVTMPSGYIKSSSTTTPTNICFVINLITGAVTLWTNVGILGSSLMPPASPYKALAVVESAPGQTDVIDLSSLFSTSTMTTNDMFTCNGYTSGPDFYVETKKYDISDPQIKKLMKQMMLHFKCDGGNLALDTVVGLNTTGATSSSVFADSNSAFVDKRIKFLKRTQYIQFRIYKASAGTKDIWLGPWAIGYKFQRPGRV